MQPRLSICVFACSESMNRSLEQILGECSSSGERYLLHSINSLNDFSLFIEEHKEEIDCLVVLNDLSLQPVLNELYEQGTFLPIVIVEPATEFTPEPTYLYHSAELKISFGQIDTLAFWIDQAIAQFLHLGPSCSLADHPSFANKHKSLNDTQNFLMLQQRRLAEKLKERLGYLGVYYKRNSKYFYRNLSQKEKKELMKEFAREYREIVLGYFLGESDLNQAIDQFVNKAFFADFSVSQILELHMELMDDFAQQLKLEGRSDEILLDYRLTLIDIIAHLCEMYRRSIPRDDVPFDLLFRLD